MKAIYLIMILAASMLMSSCCWWYYDDYYYDGPRYHRHHDVPRHAPRPVHGHYHRR